MMYWKLIAGAAAIMGVAVIAGSMEGKNYGEGKKVPKGLNAQRRAIRKMFDVTPACQITYLGDSEKADLFWIAFSTYLVEMIRLAGTIGVVDAQGVATYTMLNLFPECDPAGEHTSSYQLMVNALTVRIGALMGVGQ